MNNFNGLDWIRNHIDKLLLAVLCYFAIPLLYLPFNIAEEIGFDFGLLALEGLVVLTFVGIILYAWLGQRIDQSFYREDLQEDQNPWLRQQGPINLKWLVTFLICYAIFSLYSFGEILFLEAFGTVITENEAALDLITESAQFDYWWGIDVAIFTPIIEEVFYRQIIMGLFFRQKKASHAMAAIILSGLLFGIDHASGLNVEYLAYAASGMVFAGIYRYSGDIRIPILVHMVNNFVAMLA